MKNLKIIILLTGICFLSGLAYGRTSVSAQIRSTLKVPHVKICIHYPEAVEGDQIVFNVSMHSPITRMAGSSEFKENIVSANAKGDYEVNLQLSSEQETNGIYVSAYDMNNGSRPVAETGSKSNFFRVAEILDNYFFQNGDNVTINVKRKTGYQPGTAAMNNFILKFSGNGKYKYQLRNSVDSIRYAEDFIFDYCNKDSSFVKDNHNAVLAHNLLSYLKPYIKLINKQAYEELRIHAFFSATSAEALGTRLYVREHGKQSSKEFRAKFSTELNITDTLRWAGFNRQSLYHSYDFWKAEVEKYFAVSDIRNPEHFADSLVWPLSRIKDPEIKEHLYLLLATEFIRNFNNYSGYLQSAAPYIKSLKGKALLSELVRTNVGQDAYNFNLPDVNGNHIKLSDFKGKVIFLDFWYTGCENCRGYYDSVLSKVEEKFKSRPDIVFITISIDKNRDFWIRSLESDHYTSKTAINLLTNGRGMDDDAIRFYDVQTFPRPLIIDKNQKIFKTDNALREENVLVDALNEAAKL